MIAVGDHDDGAAGLKEEKGAQFFRLVLMLREGNTEETLEWSGALEVAAFEEFGIDEGDEGEIGDLGENFAGELGEVGIAGVIFVIAKGGDKGEMSAGGAAHRGDAIGIDAETGGIFNHEVDGVAAIGLGVDRVDVFVVDETVLDGDADDPGVIELADHIDAAGHLDDEAIAMGPPAAVDVDEQGRLIKFLNLGKEDGEL